MAGKFTQKAYQRKPNPILSEGGKIPPQALDLEEAVLGAIMLEKDAISNIIDILKAECFYKDAHQKIFKAALDLSSRHDPIDMLTVASELRKVGELENVGNVVYLSHLTGQVSSSAHIEYHSRIIAQKFIQRELIRIASDIQTRAYDEEMDVEDLLDYSENQLFVLTSGTLSKEMMSIKDVLHKAISDIEEASKREDSLSGVPSGFTKLDRMTSGWQRSDLVIIAARPSMGKTAFILSMTRNMAVDHKRPIAVFSLEMSAVQIVNRLIVGETEISSDKIRSGKLTQEEWRQLESRIKPLEEAPVFIDDTAGISVFELRAKCRRLKSQYGIAMVIIDYLQLMTGTPETKGNREQEVSTISRSLKALAKELDVPVIALSQLNRSVESRAGNKRPQLSDLRESGAIEQDADVVIFIHRPEKYGIEYFDDETAASTKGIAEIIIAKHRNGAIGDVKLKFEDHLAKFKDLEAIDEFGDLGVGNYQSVVVGSKMNNDAVEFDSQSFNKMSIQPNSGFDHEAPF